MDLVTHLPTTIAGFDSVYTVVDQLSKYVYFIPCTASVTADDLAQLFLANVICKHGMPKHIISDHDPHFTSRFWTQLFNSLGCRQALSTEYHPETNGQSERFHHSVEQVLGCYVSAKQTDWDHFLPFCQFACNSTRSATTGFPPAVVVFGREPTLPMEHDVWAVTDGQVEFVAHRLEHITLVNHTVRGAVTKASKYMASMQIVLGVPYLMLWVIMFGFLLSIWLCLVSFLISWLPSSLALMPLLRLLTLLPIALLFHRHGASMTCSTLVSFNLLWVSRLGLLLIPLSALVLTPLANLKSRIFLTIVRRILVCITWLSGMDILLLRHPGSL